MDGWLWRRVALVRAWLGKGKKKTGKWGDGMDEGGVGWRLEG